METFKKYKKNIYIFVLSVVFLLGIILRFNGYMQNASFWFDECALALNIEERSLFDFFRPLDYTQSAPPLFMVMSKLMTVIFGNSEMVYRFLPLVFGIVSIFVFYFFSKKFLDKKWVILFANFLFGINYYLIYYSFEFKQYSLELLIFMLLFLWLDKIDLNSKKQCIILSISLAILPWVSLSSLFLIGAWGINLLLYKRTKIKKLIMLYLPVIFSVMFYLFKILLPQRVLMLQDWNVYWGKRILTFSLYDIKMLNDNLHWSFYPNKFTLLLLIALVVGWFFFIKDKKFNNTLMFIILIAGLFTSYTMLYPFFQRLILFFMPVGLIVFLYPLEKLKQPLIWLMFIFLCLYKYDGGYFDGMFKNFEPTRFDSRAHMQKLVSIYKETDLIILPTQTRMEFFYYKKKFNLNTKNYVILNTSITSKGDFFNILDSLQSLSKGDIVFYVVKDHLLKPDLLYMEEWLKGQSIDYEYRVRNHMEEGREAVIIRVKKK